MQQNIKTIPGVKSVPNPVKPRNGFTLVEMMIVIAIIAVLSGITFTVFASAKNSAKSTSCISNLSQHYRALAMYAGDNSDRISPMWDSDRLSFDTRRAALDQLIAGNYSDVGSVLRPYGLEPQVRQCPNDRISYTVTALMKSTQDKRDFTLPSGAFAVEGTSYTYNTLLGSTGQWADPCHIGTAEKNVRPFIFRDINPAIHEPVAIRSNVVFGDGQAKSLGTTQVIESMGCVPQ